MSTVADHNTEGRLVQVDNFVGDFYRSNVWAYKNYLEPNLFLDPNKSPPLLFNISRQSRKWRFSFHIGQAIQQQRLPIHHPPPKLFKICFKNIKTFEDPRHKRHHEKKLTKFLSIETSHYTFLLLIVSITAVCLSVFIV